MSFTIQALVMMAIEKCVCKSCLRGSIDASKSSLIGCVISSYHGRKNAVILAHGRRISEILPWDRESYLTHDILPRMSSNVIMWYYTFIDFNEVDMRIYLPEKVNITFKGI